MAERWKPIPGLEPYQASSLGRIRRGKSDPLSPRVHHAGRSLRVKLSHDGRVTDHLVHRLVLLAFGKPVDGVRYTWADGDRSNNALTNLTPIRDGRCRRCQCRLTERTGYRHTRGGYRSVCRKCSAADRRAAHDRREDRRREGLPTTCEICGASESVTRSGRVRRPALDHDHRTGASRGVLCSRCNTAIGLLDDDPERLRSAAAYLDRYAQERV